MYLGPAWRDLQRNGLAVAPDHNRHRDAGVHANQLLHVLEALDVSAVDADDHIARMDAALSRLRSPGCTWPTSAGVNG